MSVQLVPGSVSSGNGKVTHLDAVVIGAGVAGINQLYRLRDIGFVRPTHLPDTVA